MTDEDGMITLLPPGCELELRSDVVWIKFPSEDDAIIFCELLREMSRRGSK